MGLKPPTLVKVAVCLVGLALIGWISLSALSARHMAGYVPAKLGLGLRWVEGNCINNLFGYAGAVSFDLDAQTIRDIEEQGIGYFADVDRPRNGQEIPYVDWKETPAPDSEMKGEVSNHLYCGWHHGWFWPGGFQQALESPGGFYSNGLTGRSVVVLPSLGVVAISMHSR